jgi:hypothetical protein
MKDGIFPKLRENHCQSIFWFGLVMLPRQMAFRAADVGKNHDKVGTHSKTKQSGLQGGGIDGAL